MKYMGSKARIAKHILPIILKDRKDGQWYVEPFVGGANMIDKVEGDRIGSDSNMSVIDALTFIRDCDTPKTNSDYTERRYMIAADRARNGLPIESIDSYALIAFSFGAKWIGGWSRGVDAKGKDRDYVAEQHRASTRQKPGLSGIHLISKSYDELQIPPESIIYCDPPYAGTTKYKDDFDHDKFWQWCREKCEDGHVVFVSEYSAPDDFVCVWSGELSVTVQKYGTKKATERLFVHKSQA